MSTFLWTAAWVVTIIFLVLLFLIWLRKINFDAIHHNFLDLEDAFEGKVIRNGFAVRPRFSGKFKGQDFSVSISTERDRNGRRYYIAVSMQAKARFNLTIMSNDWLARRSDEADTGRHIRSLQNGRYVLETSDSAQLKKINIGRMEKIIPEMDPFAYVLVANNGMILERTSTNIVSDTKLEIMRPLLEGLYALKKLVE